MYNRPIRYVLIVLAVLALASLSCGKSARPDQAEIVATATNIAGTVKEGLEEIATSIAATIEPEAEAELARYPLGEAIEVGDYRLAVLGWERVAGTTLLKPEPDHVFLAVEMVLVNEGTKAAQIAPLAQAALKDSTGQRYTQHLGAQAAIDSPGIGGELEPGERIRGKVGFEVPEAVIGDLALLFDAKLLGGGQILVELGAEPVSLEPPDGMAGEEARGMYAVGDIAEVDDLTLVVLGWENVPGKGITKPAEGQAFVAVEVLLLNRGSKSAQIAAELQMALKDASGQRYTPHLGAQLALGFTSPSGELAAGERVRGKVAFQVPQDALGSLHLAFDTKVVGSGQVFVDLGAEPVSIEPPETLPGE